MLKQIVTAYDGTVVNSYGNSDPGNHGSTVKYPSVIRRNFYKSGSSVPDFRWRISHGYDASSAYQLYDERVTGHLANATLSYTYHYEPNGPSGSGHDECTGQVALYGVGDFLGASDRALSTVTRAKLNVDFLNQVQAVSQKVNGPTFLGEIRETLQTLRHPASSLRNGLRDYLSTVTNRVSSIQKSLSRPKRVVAANKIVSESWLEFHFGWQSLLSDIRGAGSALNAQLDPLSFECVKVKASGQELVVEHSSEIRQFGIWKWNVFQVIDLHVTARMSGRLVRRTKSPISFNERIGFTPGNFVPTIWELLPFSFVADYFVNIGNCLSAAGTSTAGLETLNLVTSYTGSAKRTAVCDENYIKAVLAGFGGNPRITLTNLSPGSPVCDFKYFSYKREKLDPTLDLWVLPTLSLPTTSTKFINIGALISQALSARLAARL